MHERLERVYEELLHLSVAISALEKVEDCEDIVGVLHDKVCMLSVERDELHDRIEARDAMEDAELTREYWRAVI